MCFKAMLRVSALPGYRLGGLQFTVSGMPDSAIEDEGYRAFRLLRSQVLFLVRAQDCH